MGVYGLVVDVVGLDLHADSVIRVNVNMGVHLDALHVDDVHVNVHAVNVVVVDT